MSQDNAQVLSDLAQLLSEKGFAFCGCVGVVDEETEDMTHFGLLRDEVLPRTSENLWGLRRRRRPFVGVVWPFESTITSWGMPRWYIEFFGEENRKEFECLALEIARRFDVQFTLVMSCEESRTERFPGDPLTTF